ncbi:hypothetical protein ACWGQ4_38015 [Streptomyces sp. NPDC055721]|uniref:hypothetical protein n=1 Tax=Streptomyces sp. NPDC127132 TaxID=3345374 RepID=UPI003641CB27
MELTASPTARPEFTLLARRTEIGTTDPTVLTEERRDPRRLLLAGRSQQVEVSFLGAHNAFTNYEDSRWSSVAQSESVRHQLDNGARGLSLDTHWYERSTWLCVIRRRATG